MAHVFISYAHQDGIYARKLADHLLASGFDVWIDDRIDFGSRWIREIFGAIDACSAFIVIMTPRAFEREWVENERLYAKRRGKAVFPLLLEGEAFPDLGATQYYDITGEKLPGQDFFEDLAKHAPRNETGGQDVAIAPQQEAKLQHETAEIAQAEISPDSTFQPPAELDDVDDAASSRQVASSPRRSRGSFIFVAALVVVGVAAGGIAALVAPTLNHTEPTPTATATSPELTASQGSLLNLTTESPASATATQQEQTPTQQAAATLAPTPLGGGPGEIAFASDRSGNWEIYLVNVDGSDPRNLTNDPAEDTEPAWSPDGSQIVFTSFRLDGNSRLYIMDADGSNARLIIEEQGGWDPAWSPDGTQIAFSAYGDDSAEIFVINTDGSDLHAVTNDSVTDGYPAWSPDGSQIAFVSMTDSDGDIHIVDVDSGDVHALTEDETDDDSPMWSPDGTHIAFTSNDRACFIDTDGSNRHCVPNDQADAYDPAWSPDGTQIVFDSYRDDSLELYIMDADGMNVRRLTDDPATDQFATWRPSPSLNPDIVPTATPSGGGRGEIAFVSGQNENSEIYVMDTDGNNLRNLTNNDSWDSAPAWSPDGSQVAFTSNLLDNNPRLFIMDADGSNVHQLDIPFAGWDAAWSPDGTQIAFTAYGTESADIFVVDTDGDNLVNLTDNTIEEGYPAWAPDGSQIVFAAIADGAEDIYIMDADGGNARPFTDDPASEVEPAWSPDGSQIAFQSNKDGYGRIYIMDADGGNLHPMESEPRGSLEPAWSPDGSQIVFTSYIESNDGELYIVGADGTNRRRITNNTSEEQYAAWHP